MLILKLLKATFTNLLPTYQDEKKTIQFDQKYSTAQKFSE